MTAYTTNILTIGVVIRFFIFPTDKIVSTGESRGKSSFVCKDPPIRFNRLKHKSFEIDSLEVSYEKKVEFLSLADMNYNKVNTAW